MKRLIITGDDFGASPQVNEAVETLHRQGFLTQASLMVEEPALAHAVEIARRNPRLVLGLHLTVCTDFGGKMPRSPTWAGLGYAFLPHRRRALREIVERQFTRFAALGLGNVYWDGHTHSHLHPIVFREALIQAKKYRFHAMRLVQDATAPGLAPRILSLLSERAKPTLAAAGLVHVHQSRGLAATGRVDQAFLKKTLATLPKGDTELYLHPGAEPAPFLIEPLLSQMVALDIKPITARHLGGKKPLKKLVILRHEGSPTISGFDVHPTKKNWRYFVPQHGNFPRIPLRRNPIPVPRKPFLSTGTHSPSPGKRPLSRGTAFPSPENPFLCAGTPSPSPENPFLSRGTRFQTPGIQVPARGITFLPTLWHAWQ